MNIAFIHIFRKKILVPQQIHMYIHRAACCPKTEFPLNNLDNTDTPLASIRTLHISYQFLQRPFLMSKVDQSSENSLSFRKGYAVPASVLEPCHWLAPRLASYKLGLLPPTPNSFLIHSLPPSHRILFGNHQQQRSTLIQPHRTFV